MAKHRIYGTSRAICGPYSKNKYTYTANKTGGCNGLESAKNRILTNSVNFSKIEA